MKDKGEHRDPKSQTQGDNGQTKGLERGLLSLGHAFFNKYVADVEKEDDEKDVERKWLRAGAIAAIIYTALTVVILTVSAYQTSISRDTERRQLRAYVSISPGDVENFGEQNQKVRLERRNFGQTPAYDVGFSTVGFGIIPPGGTIPFGPGGCVKTGSKAFTMFPSVELKWDIIVNKAFGQKELESVRNSVNYFVYYGNICYTDAFGDTHYTNYCWMYKGNSMTAKEADACLGYNDSD